MSAPLPEPGQNYPPVHVPYPPPPRPPASQTGSNVWATASLVLGVVGTLFLLGLRSPVRLICLPLGLVGLILGIIGWSQNEGRNQRKCAFGILLSLFALLPVAIVLSL